jgi:NAD-specific glutamate dehydrogenase
MVESVVRDDVLTRVSARVAELAAPSDPPGTDAFVRVFYEHLDESDFVAHSVDNLAIAALEQWRQGARRGAGEALVRVYNPTHGHTIVDVIVDDMPFLVDSLTMALERHELGIHLVAHPIVRVARTGAASSPTTRLHSTVSTRSSNRGHTSRSTARPASRRSPRCAPTWNACCAMCAPPRAIGARCSMSRKR